MFMNINAFERREQALELRLKVLQAEEERLRGEKTRSIQEARRELKERAGTTLWCKNLANGLGGSEKDHKRLNDQGYRMIIWQWFVSIYRQFGEKIYIYHIANTETEYTKLFH